MIPPENSNSELDKQIAIYREMIDEIELNNHFEANPEVLHELYREYHHLLDKKKAH